MFEKIYKKLSLFSLPRPLSPSLRLLMICSFALIVFCAAFYWLYYTDSGNSDLSRDTEVAKHDSKIKITPDMDLVQKIIYSKCGDEEVFRTKPPDNLIGLNFNQLQKIYSGWNITTFDTKEVEMSLKVDSLCREHANNMFIGIKDGYVAVYYGVPGPKAIIKEVTKIPVSSLTPQDLGEIRQGLVIQTKEELLRTLEGLQK
ncbi:MAG TPA: BofC C-terminal domain-containing protein [Methylomusa anaerophila]|uniref:Bypass of forespore C C-terminal domain-containing protein n=1 Tax=Methylomusa anaerophila TaxID=1930071 RepID=A0A348AP59_9FIRM|nr:BofC C-terminal domain-containing protein [Methylomusa anaerophila]BBB92857.1 hypothetical protein MAMMFC1_03565 [Methylomusa anaerophila]HML87307.1 BofC C-terminal domain-containing protein [Methylomusa anaerophila]